MMQSVCDIVGRSLRLSTTGDIALSTALQEHVAFKMMARLGKGRDAGAAPNACLSSSDMKKLEFVELY